jgi:hypothetical protein
MYIRIILVLVGLLLAGCQSEQSVSSQAKPIGTPQGMIDYLVGQRIPALDGVGVWENPYGPGLRLRTKHYEIYTTLLEPLMLSQVPGFVESCYRGYNKQLPKPVETEEPFVMYLFGQRGQWELFTRKFTGRNAEVYIKIKAGAYYLNGVCVAYDIGRERTFSVIGHEGWHQFNSRHFRYRLPSWLDEGIAMLFEWSRYEGGLFYFEPAKNIYRLGSLKQILINKNNIPLDKLISLNPGEVLMSSENDAVNAFYSQAYSLVRFLREDGYGRRLGNFHQMLLGGLHGDWPLNDQMKLIAADRNIPLTIGWNRFMGRWLFEEYIGDDFGTIEDEYLTFCRKMVYPVRLK